MQGYDAIVVFEGYYTETLGIDKKITGDQSLAATVTIYGVDGNIKEFEDLGLTVSSNPTKYSMIESGLYHMRQVQMHTSPYHKGSYNYKIERLVNNDNEPIDHLPIAGGGSNKITGKSYMESIFFHRTNWDGNAGNSSQGCLLLDGRYWSNIDQLLQTSQNILLKLNRK